MTAQAQAIAAKIARLAAMDKAYAFRLAAICAVDQRPGKVWN